jgi:hypothetical protein
MRGRRRSLPGHGFPPPCPLQVDPRKRPSAERSDGPSARVTNPSRIQILKVVEIEKTEDIRRPYIKQLLTKKLKFPLPHRKTPGHGKTIFAASRPNTFF